MKKLFEYAKSYVREMDLCDVALLKLCLGALGLLIGLGIPKGKKKPFLIGALLLFFATYFPLMGKLVHIAARDKKSRAEAERVEAAN